MRILISSHFFMKNAWWTKRPNESSNVSKISSWSVHSWEVCNMRIHNYLNLLERSGMETDVRPWETQPKANKQNSSDS